MNRVLHVVWVAFNRRWVMCIALVAITLRSLFVCNSCRSEVLVSVTAAATTCPRSSSCGAALANTHVARDGQQHAKLQWPLRR